MTFLTPATRFTPDEARVYTRRLLDGFEPPTDNGAFMADRAEVRPGFFEAAGIEIVRGRNFNDADRPDPWSSSVRRWRGTSGRTATPAAGSSGGTTTILPGSSSVWRATRR